MLNASLCKSVVAHRFSILYYFNDDESMSYCKLKYKDFDNNLYTRQTLEFSCNEIEHKFLIILAMPEDFAKDFKDCIKTLKSFELCIYSELHKILDKSEFIIEELTNISYKFDYGSNHAVNIIVEGTYNE
jgi:hypothetical protein